LRDFPISRKSSYNVFDRIARRDRWRSPVRRANKLPDQIARLIVSCKMITAQGGPQDPRLFISKARPLRRSAFNHARLSA
jgi:hypothetical protein